MTATDCAETPGGMGTLTVTLPSELAEFVEREAILRGVSQSQVVGEALAARKVQEAEPLAAEGYQYYAVEACEYADASLSAFAAVLNTSNPPWGRQER